MFKAIILFALIALATSEPLRERPMLQRNFGRQAVAKPLSPAPTSYPVAGVKPEVPFELPSSTVTPDMTYFPPDNTYGVPALPAESEAQPDEVYGSPDAEEPIKTDNISQEVDAEELQPTETIQYEEPINEEDMLVTVTEDGSVIAVSAAHNANENPVGLYQRFPQSKRTQKPVPERLVLGGPQRFIYTFHQQNFK